MVPLRRRCLACAHPTTAAVHAVPMLRSRSTTWRPTTSTARLRRTSMAYRYAACARHALRCLPAAQGAPWSAAGATRSPSHRARCIDPLRTAAIPACRRTPPAARHPALHHRLRARRSCCGGACRRRQPISSACPLSSFVSGEAANNERTFRHPEHSRAATPSDIPTVRRHKRKSDAAALHHACRQARRMMGMGCFTPVTPGQDPKSACLRRAPRHSCASTQLEWRPGCADEGSGAVADISTRIAVRALALRPPQPVSPSTTRHPKSVTMHPPSMPWAAGRTHVRRKISTRRLSCRPPGLSCPLRVLGATGCDSP